MCLHHRIGDLERPVLTMTKKQALHHRIGDLETLVRRSASLYLLHHRIVITSTDKCIKHIRGSPKESFFR